jgi:hypothetical protein
LCSACSLCSRSSCSRSNSGYLYAVRWGRCTRKSYDQSFGERCDRTMMVLFFYAIVRCDTPGSAIITRPHTTPAFNERGDESLASLSRYGVTSAAANIFLELERRAAGCRLPAAAGIRWNQNGAPARRGTYGLYAPCARRGSPAASQQFSSTIVRLVEFRPKAAFVPRHCLLRNEAVINPVKPTKNIEL